MASLSTLVTALFLLHPAPAEPEPSRFGVGYLGVTLTEENGGVSITRILINSPADRSPMRPGDRILTIDGRTIRDTNDSRAVIQSLRPGSTYEIIIQRGEEKIPFRIRPVTKPE